MPPRFASAQDRAGPGAAPGDTLLLDWPSPVAGSDEFKSSPAEGRSEGRPACVGRPSLLPLDALESPEFAATVHANSLAVRGTAAAPQGGRGCKSLRAW